MFVGTILAASKNFETFQLQANQIHFVFQAQEHIFFLEINSIINFIFKKFVVLFLFFFFVPMFSVFPTLLIPLICTPVIGLQLHD